MDLTVVNFRNPSNDVSCCNVGKLTAAIASGLRDKPIGEGIMAENQRFGRSIVNFGGLNSVGYTRKRFVNSEMREFTSRKHCKRWGIGHRRSFVR